MLVVDAKGGHRGQHLRQADAARQRTFTRLLDYRAIGHGVGKRHAELDDVGAALGQRLHDLRRDVGERVARGDVGDQRLAALRLERGQRALDAAHVGSPLTPTLSPASGGEGESLAPSPACGRGLG